MSQIEILGVRIDALTKLEIQERVKNFLAGHGQNQIATVNAEFIMAAQRDERFRAILNNCALHVADGMGPLWAAKFLSLTAAKASQSVSYSAGTKAAYVTTPDHSHEWSHGKLWQSIKRFWHLAITLASLILRPAYCRSVIPERVSGVDLLADICRLGEETGSRVFLLGGKPGIAAAAAGKLLMQFPSLKIDWKLKIEHWELAAGQAEQSSVLNSLNEYRADILFVAANHPHAQLWIAENLAKIPDVKVAIGVGGAFDFIAGRVKRAPKTWQNLGLEWLWRLFRQPWRLQRISNATFNFTKAVFKSAHEQ